MRIDLNCDCGESFGLWVKGNDEAVLLHVTSANVACGAHASDPNVMRRTLHLASELNVSVGAHPGYPDLQGFGRRVLPMSPEEIFNCVLAQIGALAAIARAERLRLVHVKPHGALYNYAAKNLEAAQAIAEAVAAFDEELILVGLANSALIEAGLAAGLRVAREAFADRAYEANGNLRQRGQPHAMIEDNQAALEQALQIVRGFVIAYDGTRVPLEADTICLHGDTPGAAERAQYLNQGLLRAGVDVVALPLILSGSASAGE